MQLDAFREALGTGFQTHFEKNDLLMDIFNVSLDKERKKTQLSAVEKVIHNLHFMILISN
jgi:hypothetical protein